jgi:hypothetical protein
MTLQSTRKLLVPFVPSDPEKRSADFLIPVRAPDGTGYRFSGLTTGRPAMYGMMVFLGRSVSTNDLFAKLVDSGTKIDDVQVTIATISMYLDAIQAFKIGNIVAISDSVIGKEPFELRLVSVTPGGFPNSL